MKQPYPSDLTLKCLSIGTPKTINFPFVSNEKLMIFRCFNIQSHYNKAVIYLNFGTPKSDEFFHLEQMENLLFLGVPILKHIRVFSFSLPLEVFIFTLSFQESFIFTVLCLCNENNLSLSVATPLDDVTVSFLPLASLLDLPKKGKYQKLFHIIYFSNR